MAVYYATKAFVLSFSEAIASELEGTGVSVTALCPGPTASGFQDKADMHASALVKGKKLPTAQAVAAQGYRAMQRGQRVFIPGVMNWLMAQSTRFAPRSVVTGLVKAMSRERLTGASGLPGAGRPAERYPGGRGRRGPSPPAGRAGRHRRLRRGVLLAP